MSKTMTKAEEQAGFRVFQSAVLSGASVTAAAREAGVSRVTSQKWLERIQRQSTLGNGKLSKDAMDQVLSDLLRNEDTPMGYKAPLAAQLMKLRGYDKDVVRGEAAPKRSISELISRWRGEEEVEGRKSPAGPCPTCGRSPVKPLAQQ